MSFSYVDETKSFKESTGKKVACIGGGSASLACVASLRLKGYDVVVYEEHESVGGVLARYLPEHLFSKNDVEHKIKEVADLGVRFVTNTKFGRDVKAKTLESEGFDAIFLGLGLQLPKKTDVEGEHQKNIYSGQDFLFLSKQKKIDCSKNDSVVIVGSDVVALACADVAVMSGARVTVVSQKSYFDSEVQNLDMTLLLFKMGVGFCYNFSPIQYVGQKGSVISVKFKSKDHSSQMTLHATKVVYAVGQAFAYPKAGFQPRHENGLIKADNYMTSRAGVFAAGSCVSGLQTIQETIDEGKRAAEAIDRYLMSLGSKS